MALIFSPLSEDVLEGPYEPKPRSVFVMAPLGAGKSQIETEMDQALLITGNKALKKKIEAILAQLDTEQNVNNGLRASTKRLKKGVAEFHMLLPYAAA